MALLLLCRCSVAVPATPCLRSRSRRVFVSLQSTHSSTLSFHSQAPSHARWTFFHAPSSLAVSIQYVSHFLWSLASSSPTCSGLFACPCPFGGTPPARGCPWLGHVRVPSCARLPPPYPRRRPSQPSLQPALRQRCFCSLSFRDQLVYLRLDGIGLNSFLLQLIALRCVPPKLIERSDWRKWRGVASFLPSMLSAAPFLAAPVLPPLPRLLVTPLPTQRQRFFDLVCVLFQISSCSVERTCLCPCCLFSPRVQLIFSSFLLSMFLLPQVDQLLDEASISFASALRNTSCSVQSCTLLLHAPFCNVRIFLYIVHQGNTGKQISPAACQIVRCLPS